MKSSPLALLSRAASTSALFGGMFGYGPDRVVGRRTRSLTWSKPHQGAQEIERRRRQIERGQLTKSNGLVS